MLPNKFLTNLFTWKSLFSFVLSIFLFSVVSVSIPNDAQAVTRVTGCLNTDSGLLFLLKSGSAPLSSCPSGNPELTWSTFDITSGWTPSDDTWTYASATSFTVSGDVASQYQSGTRVKFSQSGTKYGVVKSSSYSSGTTTVTLFGNTDYSIANASITSPSYSYQDSPQGYPGWFNYTPTLSGITVGNGEVVGKFNVQSRSLIAVNIIFDAGSTSSYSGNYAATLPIEPMNLNGYRPSGQAYRQNGGSVALGVALGVPSSTTLDFLEYTSNGGVNWSSSVPFSDGENTTISANIIYQF